MYNKKDNINKKMAKIPEYCNKQKNLVQRYTFQKHNLMNEQMNERMNEQRNEITIK